MSENFGLVYESTFTGSMVGTSPTVFAVWMYVLAHGYGGQVDLNPVLLAATFGTTRQDVEAAIRLHCSPDPDSRSTVEEGRRLLHLGGVAYEIVNHDVYKNARALEERRAYNRAKKRESRERQRTTDVPIFDLSKKCLTDADPLLSSPSDLISSDPEGVQGEGDHGPPSEIRPERATAPASGNQGQCLQPRPEPSRRAPADFAPTEAQRALCRELGHDVGKLVRKFVRHEFPRPLTDWHARFDTWIDDQHLPERPPRASSPPPAKRGPPPWIDESAQRFAVEHELSIDRASSEFRKRGIPADPVAARAAFHELLRERAARVDAAFVDGPRPSEVAA